VTRRVFITLIVIAGLGVGGFFLVRRVQQANAQPSTASLQTAQVARGTLVVSVSAAGTIASPQMATVAWQTSGTVGQVHVQVGDVVNPGDTLMELDASRPDRSMIQAQVELISAQQNLDNLLTPPTDAQLAQAELNVVQARQAISTAERSLTSTMRPSVSYYQDQLTRAQAALTAAQQNAQITDYATALHTAEQAVTDTANAVNQILAIDAQYPGYASERSRLANAQATHDQAVVNYQTALYKFQQAQANDAQTVHDAQQKFDTAQANLAGAQAGPDTAKLELNQAQLDLAKANLAKAEDDLAKLKAGPDPQDVAAAKAKVAAAQLAIDAARLVAPFKATVVAVNNRVGDSVNNNTAAVMLADLSALELKANVAEVDINRIQIGQSVNLTVDAAPGQTFTGTVSETSAVGQSAQGVVTFPVTVLIPNPDPALKPGMTAAVAIVTDSHENALLVPNRAVRVSAGQRTVTVLFEGQQIPVPVTLGLSNETQSEILDGQLREGDTVVLNATTTANRNGGFFGGPFGAQRVGP
jgi:HlyD family secretion protein